MGLRGTDAIPLPPRPNIEQYHNRAKGLVKACNSDDPGAVRAWATKWLDALAARFAAGEPDTPRPTRPDFTPRGVANEAERIERELREASITGKAGGEASLAEAHLHLAQLHGFVSWPKFARHVEALSRAGSPDSDFEIAADAVVDGDLTRLTELIRANPALVRARSARDHRATLLHYTAANGHEGYRQRTPPNAVAIATFLLETGAEADAVALMYGVDSTTMDMLVSSAHPAIAGVQVELAELLLDHGAAVNGVKDNGSPLMTALAFDYPAAAHALVSRGARVDNVISAAALGRADLLDAFVTDDGWIKPGVAMAAVPWPRIPKNSKIHLAYALTWASKFGHTSVVELLLRKSVDASSGDNNLPALHFAAANGHVDIVRLLLAHGASLETLNSYGGTVLAGTLWFADNSPASGVDYASVIRSLIELGARVDFYPTMQADIDAVLRRG